MTAGASAVSIAGVPTVAGLLAPVFVGVAAVAVLITLLLYSEHPPVSRRTVVALLPWMVVGAALSVLAATADYPATVRPAVSGIGAYVTTYAVVGLVWFAAIQFMRGGRPADRLPTYLAAMGLGVVVVVLATLLMRAGALTGAQIFWLAITPIAAAAVAGLVLLLLGIWYPEAAAYTGMAGGLVVFGHTLAAIATAVLVVAGGNHSALSWVVLDLLETAGAAGAVGVEIELLWIGGFVWARLVLATVAIVALTAYTRHHPTRGNLLLGIVAAFGVIGGSTALLELVVGG